MSIADFSTKTLHSFFMGKRSAYSPYVSSSLINLSNWILSKCITPYGLLLNFRPTTINVSSKRKRPLYTYRRTKYKPYWNYCEEHFYVKGRTLCLIYISHRLSESDLFRHTREAGRNKGKKSSGGNRDREKGYGTDRLGSIDQWKRSRWTVRPWETTATTTTTVPPVSKPAALRTHRHGGAAARQIVRVRAAPASNLVSLPTPAMTMTVKAVKAAVTATVTMVIPRLPWARSPPTWLVAAVPPLLWYPYLLPPWPGWKRRPQDPWRRHGWCGSVRQGRGRSYIVRKERR